MNHDDYEVGDDVSYSLGEDTRRARVTNKELDIKNGASGFDGVLIESTEIHLLPGTPVWGYDDQIHAVYHRKKGE